MLPQMGIHEAWTIARPGVERNNFEEASSAMRALALLEQGRFASQLAARESKNDDARTDLLYI